VVQTSSFRIVLLQEKPHGREASILVYFAGFFYGVVKIMTDHKLLIDEFLINNVPTVTLPFGPNDLEA
jgi:hypothetical protein